MGKRVILASVSPRRRELMAYVHPEFEVVDARADERLERELSPAGTVQALALRKAQAAFAALPAGERRNAVVIGSDTMVALEGALLGKPRTPEEAAAMLRRLSGRKHTVYTGVAIVAEGRGDLFFESAEVEFYPLSEADIARYIATGEPMDKAGAYGIQGSGSVLVKAVYGDFYTVMGFPVAKLYRRLQPFL